MLQRLHNMHMDPDLHAKVFSFIIKHLLTGWDSFFCGYWSLPQTPRCLLALSFLLQLQTWHSVSAFSRSSTGTCWTSIHTKFFSWTTFFALCLQTTKLMLVQYFQNCERHECLQRKLRTQSWVDWYEEACCVFNVRLWGMPLTDSEPTR
jgi:hypothetical protein